MMAIVKSNISYTAGDYKLSNYITSGNPNQCNIIVFIYIYIYIYIYKST